MIAKVHEPIAEALSNFLGRKIPLDVFLKAAAHQSIHAHELPRNERQLVFLIDGILAQTVGVFGTEEIREELANAIRPFEAEDGEVRIIGHGILAASNSRYLTARKPILNSTLYGQNCFIPRLEFLTAK